jgi:hypothetical protein
MFNFHSSIVTYSKLLARHGREHMVDGFTTTCAKVPNTTNIVSLNPTHGEVYSIQHYVIKYVSDFCQAGQWFSPGTPVSSTNKTDHHNIAEILLKVALSIRTPSPIWGVHQKVKGHLKILTILS